MGVPMEGVDQQDPDLDPRMGVSLPIVQQVETFPANARTRVPRVGAIKASPILPPLETFSSSARIAAMIEASYTCDSCAEEVVIPVDLSAGAIQNYVEDCPVCCRANEIHVEIDDDEASVWAQA